MGATQSTADDNAGFTADQAARLHAKHAALQADPARAGGDAVDAVVQALARGPDGRTVVAGEFVRRARALLRGTASEQAAAAEAALAAAGGLRPLAEAVAARGLQVLERSGGLAVEPAAETPAEAAAGIAALAAMLLERPRAGWAGGLDDDEEADAGPRHYEAAGDCAAWLAHSALAQRLWTLAFGEALLGGGREARRETHETRETRGGETRARSALLTAPALLVAQEAARDGGAWDGAAAWSAAFATRTHGRSWAALQARVAGAAASLVVVRARGGAVFGGIADAALAPRPAFAGGAAARLLALGPARIAAFTPSGINANFVYFNAGAQTLPNGIGFGGQIGYFGLWVDAGLDAGHSMARPACTTFASPRLSDEDTFDVDEIEIWCLRRVEVDERLVDPAARGPGMGRAQEEAFLEMAGRTMHAKTLPEPDRGAE